MNIYKKIIEESVFLLLILCVCVCVCVCVSSGSNEGCDTRLVTFYVHEYSFVVDGTFFVTNVSWFCSSYYVFFQMMFYFFYYLKQIYHYHYIYFFKLCRH